MRNRRNKPIDVTDGAYLLARIRNACHEDGDCLIWDRYCDGGVMPVIGVKSKPRPVRRVMFEIAKGAVRDGFEVVHTCGTPRCVAVEHLDQIAKGERRRRLAANRNVRQPASQVRYMRENHSKLTMEIAREIRASDETGVVLAARYGVTHQLVSLVRRGQSWAEPSPWAGLGART